jgi:hypothetical protein
MWAKIASNLEADTNIKSFNNFINEKEYYLFGVKTTLENLLKIHLCLQLIPNVSIISLYLQRLPVFFSGNYRVLVLWNQQGLLVVKSKHVIMTWKQNLQHTVESQLSKLSGRMDGRIIENFW